MKRKLIYNYWLMIVAWCMFLNNLTILAVVLCLLGSILIILTNVRINYWRVAFVSVISYTIISLILSMSNICLFFPKLYVFIAAISLNLSLVNDRLYLIKSKYLKPFLVVMTMGYIVLSLVAVILPNDLYSIFTKSSLYIMISIIFLPYLIPLVYCIGYKEVRLYLNNRKTKFNTIHI